MLNPANLKVALVHDWLLAYGGAERVLDAFCGLFPRAPIFTSLFNPANLPSHYRQRDIRPSFLQRLPGATSSHRLWLPLMPLAFEQFDFSDFDLVISSSHACAKGIITGPQTCHVSYVHTPVRYAWDMQSAYVRQVPWLKQLMIAPLLHYIRLWDQLATQRVDALACNSHFVQRRIRKYYRREAEVIYPPVAVGSLPAPQPRQDFFLVVSRLVPYKRIDLAIQACNRLDRPLKIVGEGPLKKQLQAQAGPNITFLGYQSDASIADLYTQAQALLFPGLDDFGIVPVEAQAQGCPVIAYGQGGAAETVIAGETGILFAEQTAEALMQAISDCESQGFEPGRLNQHAQRFARRHFEAGWLGFVAGALARFRQK